MSLISFVQEFDGKEIGETNDCRPIFAKLLPALSQSELNELQGSIPCRIPGLIKDLLGITRGLAPCLESVDFSGLSYKDSFKRTDLLPHGLPIAEDGLGNYWVVDLNAHSRDWAPVFYLCNDPAVLVLQAKTFEDFIAQLISLAMKEDGSPIERMMDKYVERIFEEHPDEIDYAEASQRGDTQLSAFALQYGKDYRYIDLRDAHLGEGFCWKRFGDETLVQRALDQRIFAYKKRAGWLGRLFGKT